MFYYLSFLRPPPTSCKPNGTISITPEVANDLRTELYEGAQDIYYQWINSSSGLTLGTAGQVSSGTRPAKLTTWRQSSAYKELTVPLPSGVKGGQAWSLVLTPSVVVDSSPSSQQGGTRPGYVIDLNDNDLGSRPFPVISMPIFFGLNPTKGDGNPKGGTSVKQEKIQRVYQLLPSGFREGVGDDPSPSKGSQMIITEQTSFDLDKKIWDSGIGLSSWLSRLMVGSGSTSGGGGDTIQKVKRLLMTEENLNIIELGAGTGIVAITLAALRTALVSNKDDSHQVQDVLYTTDLPPAMPLLERNITSNTHLFPTNPPKAAILDWDNEILPEDTVETLSGKLDIIIMADVTYNTDSFPSLIRAIHNLIQLPKSHLPNSIPTKPPIIILGYKERHSAERELWPQIKEIGAELVKLGEREGAGGPHIEIWACVPDEDSYRPHCEPRRWSQSN
ncbi:hypothetical protein BDN72DRAFT_765157 [Pluteus cervinus]|uniref:Uncharacterized protein n=1 Tax=Pluteus cervinus TaxID=181527 RepID=A0ACD3AZF4_9AGAR|nr:hypothetical protein BDN72DRAFT_765157 [Pluteus cervinus]